MKNNTTYSDLGAKIYEELQAAFQKLIEEKKKTKRDLSFFGEWKNCEVFSTDYTGIKKIKTVIEFS